MFVVAKSTLQFWKDIDNYSISQSVQQNSGKYLTKNRKQRNASEVYTHWLITFSYEEKQMQPPRYQFVHTDGIV